MAETTHLQVFPGATWTASNGRHVQAHGGGFLKVGATWYWHGEDKTEDTCFQNINCYSSTDLVQWKYEGPRPIGLRFYELSNDYLSVTKMLHLFPEHLESPAMIKRNGIYCLLASQLTSRELNDDIYMTSTSLTGPWEPWKLFAESRTATYGSQVTFILDLGLSVLYMGDRWEYPPLPRSTYVWLPLSINDQTVTLKNIDSFVLDIASGEARSATPSTKYKLDNENATIASKVTFETRVTVSRLKLAIQYTSSFEKEQNLVVAAEGVKCDVAFLPTATPDTLAVTTLHIRGETPPGKHSFEAVEQGVGYSGLSVRGLVVPNV